MASWGKIYLHLTLAQWFLTLHLILNGRLEDEDLVGKYFDISWLFYPLVHHVVVVVELNHKPGVGFLLWAELTKHSIYSCLFLENDYLGNRNLEGRKIVRPYWNIINILEFGVRFGELRKGQIVEILVSIRESIKSSYGLWAQIFD